MSMSNYDLFFCRVVRDEKKQRGNAKIEPKVEVRVKGEKEKEGAWPILGRLGNEICPKFLLLLLLPQG